MHQPSAPHRSRSPWRGVILGAVLALVGSLLVGLSAAPAQAAGRATPRNFTGYGFDQCVAPSQAAMDAWLRSSPFWAVGVYTTGNSRFCRDQPNLTPTWVETQLRNGWRILPITLGPQASCTTRERYQKQERINPDPADGYARARAQGKREASTAVAEAARLGMGARSTLWYDLEGDFSVSNTHCRESALSFLSAWTTQLHALGYRSGFYSSAGTGIKMLDDARVNRPGRFAMPDQIWVARWSGVPGKINDPGTYLRADGWMPHARVHQYRGGHNETHGGVTINIDSNWLDVGRGTVAPPSPTRCGGVNLDLTAFPRLARGASGAAVKAAQCLLQLKGLYKGPMSGVYDGATIAAVRAYRQRLGKPVRDAL
ncbi:MAG TPA: glycoside hydrolase domain-containing protein, partial [Nonomuraea sp.]|nr:glycoside hydrolase domain-containing protein [Nonomuraea sp.]